MILEAATSILGSVMSGGATGLLGVLLQRYFDHRKQQTDLETLRINLQAAQAAREAELASQERLAKLGADSAERIADIQAQARASESADSLMQASYANDRATYLTPDSVVKSRVATWLMAAVDFARGMIRPGSTAYLLGLTTTIWLWCRHLTEQAGVTLSTDQALQLQLRVIETVLYLTTTTVTWWFGVRGQQRR